MYHQAHPRRYMSQARTQAGKAGYLLLWLLGVPVPLLLLFYMLRGCT